jgi:hypothetical protein
LTKKAVDVEVQQGVEKDLAELTVASYWEAALLEWACLVAEQMASQEALRMVFQGMASPDKADHSLGKDQEGN